ncbi:hypothetical protein A2U01_0000679 [Trifolium medium]|uniref:Uncharacterized protein n=1 Tax=Trifolium medium TaxID=97028 RepID=A0A392LYA0_9FABA|nr:hypothetical protein [Trifolium medium]
MEIVVVVCSKEIDMGKTVVWWCPQFAVEAVEKVVVVPGGTDGEVGLLDVVTALVLEVVVAVAVTVAAVSVAGVSLAVAATVVVVAAVVTVVVAGAAIAP